MALFRSAVRRGASFVVRRLTTRPSRALPPAFPSLFGAHTRSGLSSLAWYLAIALTLVGATFTAFRHLAYLVPFIALLYALANRRIALPAPTHPFLLLVAAAIIMWPQTSTEGWKDAFFMVSGISIALVLRPDEMRIRPLLILGLFSVMSVYLTISRNGVPTSLVVDPINSVSSFESIVSFAFGLMAVYLAATRQRWLALLALVLCVVTMKRVAVLGATACVLFSLLPQNWQRRLCNVVTGTLMNLFFITVALSYATGELDFLILDVFGVSANALGQGRQALFSTVAFDIVGEPWRFLFFGEGGGTTYALTVSELVETSSRVQIHSSILQILYEYGGLVMVTFCYLGYRQQDMRARLMFAYANVLFLTDNVLTYHYIVFFLVVLSSRLPVVAPHQTPDTKPAGTPGPRRLRQRPRPWAQIPEVSTPAPAYLHQQKP